MKRRVQEDEARYAKQLAAIKKCFDEPFDVAMTSITTSIGEPLNVSMKKHPILKETYIN